MIHFLNDTWLQDLLFTTKQVVKHGGSLYGATKYNRFVWDFIRAQEYTLRDLLCREKGALLAAQYFESITTPKQLYWFERSAHFPQWSEPERLHQVLKSIKEAGNCCMQ